MRSNPWDAHHRLTPRVRLHGRSTAAPQALAAAGGYSRPRTLTHNSKDRIAFNRQVKFRKINVAAIDPPPENPYIGVIGLPPRGLVFLRRTLPNP